ncbi:DedA family protein, partial [Thioclava sp. BHET1]
AIGCNIGSTAAYCIGAWGGRAFIHRWGKWVLLRHSHLERAEHFFARYGSATVFVGRLLPGVRSFISLPAGMARMSIWRFQIWTFLGSWPWCYALAYVGMRLGNAWAQDPRLGQAMHIVEIVVIIALLAALAIWLRRRRKRDVTRM